MLAAVLAAVVLAAHPAPRTIVSVPGQVIGVAQDGGSIAWLSWKDFHCTLTIRGPRGAEHAASVGSCAPAAHDLVLAGGAAAIGGYEDVRCSETDAMVRVVRPPARAHVVQQIYGDCRGYATAYQGLAGDGTSFYYALVTTRTPTTLNCGNGGPCSWRLGSSEVVRVAGTKKVPLRGVQGAALLAGADRRLALVEPATAAHSDGKTFDWPRAAANGKVAVYDTTSGRLVASFAPNGVVRALALSPTRAVVLVQDGAAFAIEWYDAATGAALGHAKVPPSTGRTLATDGRTAAYAVGSSVRVLDLSSGATTLVAHTAGPPVGLSLDGGRLAWGEGTAEHGLVRSVTLG